LNEDDKAFYSGRYVFGQGSQDVFVVHTDRRGNLPIKREGHFSRVMHRVEKHAFSPDGADAVRLRFDVQDGRPVSLTVHDPHPIAKALRID
jgi:hypothetical protein